MKQRIITALVGVPVFILAMFLLDTIIFPILISLISVISVYEVIKATGYLKVIPAAVASMIFAAAVPFFTTSPISGVRGASCFVYIIALFVAAIICHEKMPLERLGMVFMMSLLVPFGLACLVFTRDFFPQDAVFYVVLIIVAAWMTDIGAYFIGSFFGKHKLVPKISPKKTVEGAVGGIAVSLISVMIISVFYQFVILGDSADISWGILIAYSIAAAVVSMLGDLAASLVKRACGVKDFGKLLPGHGGLLDRFDSVLFVAPLTFFVILYFPIITR
ncbi:MAG: phosphatidate cytidylyltransferase [Clostridiales bacterium]|nr:phosphatidate cytidylyltransferase [Clostridiales bacterium]